MTDFRKNSRNLMCVAALVALTAAAYLPVRTHTFVNYDDNEYVTENSHVRKGLTAAGIRWAFTATHAGNWHPLTWISHMVDVELFGLDAGRHHLAGLAFHILNAVLLFAVLRGMTGAFWRSGAVAALFALHPLHVESVAWVAERKDVLSTSLWMLTLAAYLRYVRHPGTGRYLAVVGAFSLGLMAKPMLVTLPFVLLLLDLWPLGRGREGAAGIRRLLREKVPLFALSAASSLITYFAQSEWTAVKSISKYPLWVRGGNALLSYGAYLGKALWPRHLVIFHPHPGEALPLWQVGGAGLLLAGCTVAVCLSRRRPYLAVGWLWYLGTLLPVIGLIQVGDQGMADRYTYVPLIGIFIMAAWGTAGLLGKGRFPRTALSTAAVTVAALMAVMTTVQVGYWRDNITLFRHTFEFTEEMKKVPHYEFALNNMGMALAGQGRHDEAEAQYRLALQVRPDFGEAHYNLGNLLVRKSAFKEAIPHYREALRINPESAAGYSALAGAHFQRGDLDDAVENYRRALAINPDQAQAHHNIGVALSKQGRLDEAIAHFRGALRSNPDYASAHYNLGLALSTLGMSDQAMHHYSEALRVDPGFTRERVSLEAARSKRRPLPAGRNR